MKLLDYVSHRLNQPDIEHAVRAGDIFAVLIEYYYETKNYQTCYEMLKKMQERKIIATPYIDTSIVHDQSTLDPGSLYGAGY
jgi:intraflagellar transport protein 140